MCLKSFPWRRICKLCLFYILFWSDGSISLPVRYWYLSIFLDDNIDLFAASLLILYSSFSSLTLSSIARINFYILSQRFFLKRKKLSDGRVVSITKKRIWFCSALFIKIMTFWKQMFNEWLKAIFWTSLSSVTFLKK